MINLLLHDPIPRQQLNTFIFHALRPVIAAIGPWSSGYGLRPDNLEISVLVSSDANGIRFSQQTNPPASSVILEEIQEETLQDTAPVQPSTMEPMHNHSSELSQDNTGSATRSTADHNPRISQDSLGLAAVSAITMPSGPVVTRGRRTRAPAPISTTEVRRSNRSNKYNGFKTQQVTDTRPIISRVKPRLVPSIGSSSSAQVPQTDVIPPTPVHVLQEIGINRCAVPAAELTEEILVAAPQPTPASTQRTTTPPDEQVGEYADPMV